MQGHQLYFLFRKKKSTDEDSVLLVLILSVFFRLPDFLYLNFLLNPRKNDKKPYSVFFAGCCKCMQSGKDKAQSVVYLDR